MLVVLVVLIAIFTGVIGGRFVPLISACETSGGTCYDSNEEGVRCVNTFNNDVDADYDLGTAVSGQDRACQENADDEEYRCCPSGFKVIGN